MTAPDRIVPAAVTPPQPHRILVVGGVAAGMGFAARARRLSENAEIVVLERDEYVSFANCGLPYHVGGEIAEREKLILHTPASLAAALRLDVRTGHQVMAVDAAAHTVTVHRRATGDEIVLPYDALILATGAEPLIPPVPGVDLPVVRTLRTVPDADALRALVAAGARQAVVVGAGFIGLEAAEALHQRGLDVTVVELAPQVLPPLDPEMAQAVEQSLRTNGVTVHTSTSMTAIHPHPREGSPDAVEVELADGTLLPTDLVILAAGVRPASHLAATAGADLGPRGHILVDEHLATSTADVYAVGDAIQVVDAVTGTPTAVPLAGPANRQGRALADHLLGTGGHRASVLGTAIVRVFDTVAGTTGRSEKSLKAAGFAHHVLHIHPAHHAGYFPGAQGLHLKLVFSPDGRVLGAQITGGEGVDKRIDVIATAIRARMNVDDLADLELAYAPPFGSAKDPVNMAGFVAQNVLAGLTRLWGPDDLDPILAETATGQHTLLDVRSPAEFAAGHLPGALNIAHTALREHLDEVPTDRPVAVYCASGFRSYLALRVLAQHGHPNATTLDGGLDTLRHHRPDLPLITGAQDTALLAAATR